MRAGQGWESSYEAARAPLARGAEDGMTSQMWLFFLYGTTDRKLDLPYKAAPAFKTWGHDMPPLGLVFSQTKAGWSSVLGTP
jgi:hypothetical protein